MNKLITSAFFLSATWATAQPVIQNAEDFTIGTTLQFLHCNPSNVNPGNSGPNQLWDFSGLTSLNDTTTEWMVSPSATPYGGLFPNAQLAEEYSDGSYVFASKTANGNYLEGYVDVNSGITIHYPDPLQFAARPITYGQIFNDVFRDHYTASGFNFSGAGTVTIEGDGFGTLILPNGTYTNVLRVKITQNQTDTLIQFQSVSTSTSVIYTWFDGVHTSALLKIEATQSSGFADSSVSYLLQETLSTGSLEPQPAQPLRIYPNPATDEITVLTPGSGDLFLTDDLGKSVCIPVRDVQSTISVSQLKAGKYLVTWKSKNESHTTPLLITR